MTFKEWLQADKERDRILCLAQLLFIEYWDESFKHPDTDKMYSSFSAWCYYIGCDERDGLDRIMKRKYQEYAADQKGTSDFQTGKEAFYDTLEYVEDSADNDADLMRYPDLDIDTLCYDPTYTATVIMDGKTIDERVFTDDIARLPTWLYCVADGAGCILHISSDMDPEGKDIICSNDKYEVDYTIYYGDQITEYIVDNL